jgi:hypothetical protein
MRTDGRAKPYYRRWRIGKGRSVDSKGYATAEQAAGAVLPNVAKSWPWPKGFPPCTCGREKGPACRSWNRP